MLQNSMSRKIFGVVGSLLIAVNSFAWGPWNHGKSLREKWFPEVKNDYEDPLLPYIHPGGKVSDREFHELMTQLSHEQRGHLWKALKGPKAEGIPSVKMLENEFLWVSSHWATYPFKSVVHYHETVQWVAKKLDVHNAECESATTFQLERRITEKIFAKMWDKLTPDQRVKILKEAGLEPNQARGYAVLGSSAFLAAMATSAYALGFTFYIIVAKTLVVLLAPIGIGASTTIGIVAVLVGPIGWCIAGASAVVGGYFTGRANPMKTAAFIVLLHNIKVAAMTKSGIDINQYILE